MYREFYIALSIEVLYHTWCDIVLARQNKALTSKKAFATSLGRISDGLCSVD